jgi:hypothetical protein
MTLFSSQGIILRRTSHILVVSKEGDRREGIAFAPATDPVERIFKEGNSWKK